MAAGFSLRVRHPFVLVSLLMFLAGSSTTPLRADSLAVDFNSGTGKQMDHRASGFLHSFGSGQPADALVAPLKPKLFRARPDGHEDSGAFNTHDRAKALGAQVQLVVSDGWPTNYQAPWPGDNGDWLPWENHVRGLVLRAKLENKTFQWDIWNEPDIGYFWGRTPQQYLETYQRGVQQIRLLDPGATIVGPSLANVNSSIINVQQFLTYAKQNNVLPDVLAWHEFDPNFTQRVQDVRNYMAAENINISRISLNEIVESARMFRPGTLTRYFTNIHRADVESAAHA